MRKPYYAIAMDKRIADKKLDEKFKLLPDRFKWAWLAFACENKPSKSIAYARQLINETNSN